MSDQAKSVHTKPYLWRYLDRGINLLQLPLLAGTVLSAISTPIIIFAYCKNHRMTFLMPLVFSKIALNTFLLFLIPILLVLVLPAILGFLGGLSGIELKQKLHNTCIDGCKNPDEVVNKGRSSSSYSDKLIPWLKKTLMNEIAYQWYFFVFVASLVVIAFYSLFFGLLLVIFYILLLLNGLIFHKFLMKDIKIVKCVHFIIPLLLPMLGGGLLGFIYYFISSQFLHDYHYDVELILSSFFMSTTISVFSFWVTLKNMKVNNPLIIGLFAIFVVFIYPKILLWSSFADSYFRWARYGNIPVQVQWDEVIKGKGTSREIIGGKILFNSGSEFFIRENEKLTSEKVAIYLKKGDELYFSEDAFRKNQIIRVPYKYLESIPSF